MVLIEFAAHAATLDVEEGILVLPRPADDLELTGSPSLHWADWDAALGHLATHGWQPLEADADEEQVMGAVLVGVLSDGREVIALEPIGA